MKRVTNLFILLLLGFMVTALSSCFDAARIADDNTELPDGNWAYTNKAKFDVKIDNPQIGYNLYLNLRVSSSYKYANIFVLLSTSGPKLKKGTARYELTLAKPDGEWLGKGSGDLYNYQVRYLHNYKFPAKGIYHFEIEQNMRDNPLREVSDVGLRVEKAE